MNMEIVPQVLSGMAWVLYGSLFEWYWHKEWMHKPRVPREAFRGHTLVHHQIYKVGESYVFEETGHPQHILLKPYALPAIVLVHLPILFLINYLIPHTFWGGLIAISGYFVVYEYCHWHMHVPRGHRIEKFRWFKYLAKHHELHHRYFQKNFCVLFPLADLVFGTLITEESLAKQKAAREAALAAGKLTTPTLASPTSRQEQRRNARKLRQMQKNQGLIEEFSTYRVKNNSKRRFRKDARLQKELVSASKDRE